MRKTTMGTPSKLTAPTMILVTLVCAVLTAAQTRKPVIGGSPMFAVHTTAFEPSREIPTQYTCSGPDSSPALSWDGAPKGTQSFALITDDPDAPVGTFTHWVMYDIPASSRGLSEGIAKSEQLHDGSRQGRNDFRRIGYGGPCPPPGKPHRYFFKVYALDTKLSLNAGATRDQVEAAMKGHVLAEAALMGTFQR